MPTIGNDAAEDAEGEDLADADGRAARRLAGRRFAASLFLPRFTFRGEPP